MGTRRDAREWAIQMLFSLDLNPSSVSEVFAKFWEGRPNDEQTRRYAEGLVNGVRQNQTAIDKLIAEYASNWNIDRMAVIERNVLRLSIYEMVYCTDIPPNVSINEAVDLAKYFNSSESGKFVNGILDRAKRALKKNGETES